MENMKTYIKQSLMGLSRQVIEKSYQQQTLGSRLQRFQDTRRETRNEAMLQRRNIDAVNISPFESVQKKKSASKLPATCLPSNRLEKLKKWRAEKEKRKLDEKKTMKPVFKVCHLPNNIGLPNYETINKEIKGKLIKSLAKTDKPKPSLLPKSQQFKAPQTIKPLYFNIAKRKQENKIETSSNKNNATARVKKSETVTAKISEKPIRNTASRVQQIQKNTLKVQNKTEVAKYDLVKSKDKPERETSGKSLESCSSPARRITRLMSMKMSECAKKSDNIKCTSEKKIQETKSKSAGVNKKTPRTPKSKTIPVPTSPHTPELPSKLQEELINYVSPFVTISRGKDSIRKEHKRRMSTGGAILGNSATSPSAAAPYFSNMLRNEIERIENMCAEWSSYKEGDVPEEAKEMIDVALGQSKLLMSKKFQQFKQLIEQCKYDDDSMQSVTCMDLHGYWDMMYMQVEDIDRRFNNLSVLRSNQWKEVLAEQKTKPKKTKGKRVKPQASSKIRDMIKQAKANNNQLKQQSPFMKIYSPRQSSSPGMVAMRLSQSIKRNNGLTPNRSILKTEDTKEKKTVKNVFFSLNTVRNKLDFDMEDKENTKDPETRRTPLRRSLRLSKCAD